VFGLLELKEVYLYLVVKTLENRPVDLPPVDRLSERKTAKSNKTDILGSKMLHQPIKQLSLS
jgi:hypothetical protein